MPPVRALLLSLGLASTGVLSPAAAQVSRPVVQAVPGGDGMRLNAALSRLARNPRDIDALIDAGVASLAAGDGDAAIGFYQKADALSPNNARIKAGLAGAYVLTGDPASAIPLFDTAERLGMMDGERAADRALAFDMVGDATTAQRYYHEALMAGPNDETSRRLALSQAIAGDRRGMEVTLGPLLQRQDKAAWRTRAFALAILGQAEEAESIARSTMPADMAAAMTNYLRYMTRLTPAQQAAAANLGVFPRAAEIGRDDPRLAALVRTRPVLAGAAASRTAPVKLAQRDDRKDRKDRKAKPAPVEPPVVKVASAAPAGELPPVASTTLAAATPPSVRPVGLTVQPAVIAAPTPKPVETAPQPTIAAAAPVTAPAASPAKPEPGFASLDNPAPKFDLKPSPPPPAPEPAPVAAKPPAKPAARPTAPAKPRSLAEVFADLTPPSREAEPKAGAVDLRKIAAAKPAAKAASADPRAAKGADKACEAPDPKAKAAKPAKGKTAAKPTATQCKVVPEEKAKGPTNPSRIWVQVATGRDKKALAFDWRRMTKDDAALFKGRKAFTSTWGQANRLLTGPFDTAAQANAFVAQLKKAGVGGAFAWNSPAGQVVDALPGS